MGCTSPPVLWLREWSGVADGDVFDDQFGLGQADVHDVLAGRNGGEDKVADVVDLCGEERHRLAAILLCCAKFGRGIKVGLDAGKGVDVLFRVDAGHDTEQDVVAVAGPREVE